MNINDYAPKHVDLEEVKAKAVRYEGTFEELKRLHQEGKVTLVTGSTGEVTGLWVDSGTGDVMVDNLSGQNFNRAYGCKPVMRWIDMILRGEEPEQDEEVEEPCQQPISEELPTEATINYDELESVDVAGVKKYLRDAYDRYLAGGCELEIEFDDIEAVAKVSGIEFGRKRY